MEARRRQERAKAAPLLADHRGGGRVRPDTGFQKGQRNRKPEIFTMLYQGRQKFLSAKCLLFRVNLVPMTCFWRMTD
jgi:hypothetical protein